MLITSFLQAFGAAEEGRKVKYRNNLGRQNGHTSNVEN